MEQITVSFDKGLKEELNKSMDQLEELFFHKRLRHIFRVFCKL